MCGVRWVDGRGLYWWIAFVVVLDLDLFFCCRGCGTGVTVSVPLPHLHTFVTRSTHPLPYRLSTQVWKVVNRRACEIMYPHYTPVCHVGEDSFINNAGCWRTDSKLIVTRVLSSGGCVSKFRRSLRSPIWGLRMLEGETFSVQEANKLNLEHGFLALEKEIVRVV